MKRIEEIVLPFRADSVECTPLNPYISGETRLKYGDDKDNLKNVVTYSLVACGLYELQDLEKPKEETSTASGNSSSDVDKTKIMQQRSGGVMFFIGNGETLLTSRKSFIPMPGVFDMRWSNANKFHMNNNILACACADGTVKFVAAKSDIDATKIENKMEIIGSCDSSHMKDENKDIYSLSIDWNEANTHLVVSQNTGRISLIKVAMNKPYEIQGVLEKEWEGHTYSYSGSTSGVGAEVWTAAFHKSSTANNDNFIIYSGAEDGKMKAWDTRMDRPIFVDKDSHSAGICTISFDHHDHHRFATGCYDSCIRIWDDRKQKSGPVSEPLDVEGGVWRIKWHPKKRNVLSAACMRGGFRIFNLNEDLSMEVVDKLYDEPMKDEKEIQWEQLAYGIDWLPSNEGDDKTHSLLGASFYDRSLRVYR